jgi:hypothetical protein
MRAEDSLSVTSRARLRAEIAAQVEQFLRGGGRIDVVQSHLQGTRPIGPVWRDVRSSGPVVDLR